MRKVISPLVLLCFFTLSGSTVESNQRQSTVEVKINLPSSGDYNEWTIAFTSTEDSYFYEFTTDDDTFESGILGRVRIGEYDISFNSGYSCGMFDLGVYGPNGLEWETGYPGGTVDNQEIGTNSSVQIDHVYGCDVFD